MAVLHISKCFEVGPDALTLIVKGRCMALFYGKGGCHRVGGVVNIGSRVVGEDKIHTVTQSGRGVILAAGL